MRLLQPRLHFLYLISKKEKVKDNISEISRLLRYEKDSWTNNFVNELLDEKFIEKVEQNGMVYLRLTTKGRRMASGTAFGLSFGKHPPTNSQAGRRRQRKLTSVARSQTFS